MKKYIFCMAALAALAITSCRKIEADGDKEIVYVNQGGGNGGTTGQTIILQGRINADTLLKKENNYILKGLVYVVGNHTMTIQAGTVIKGSFSGTDVAALIITRGSKINAIGNALEPIVFTSSSPNPQSGDWGGIILCGKAGINTNFNAIQGLFQVEGGVDNSFGDGLAGSGDAAVPTAIDTDNSGTMSYVRIEYAGYAFVPDKEINSLTMAAVGSGTTIDHIQTIYAKDDAFEWFGGTVNCKYLIATKTQDDDFDTDNGYRGNVQFGIIIRDSAIADISKSEAFESDNNSGGSTTLPKTAAVFSNVTAIGPRATLNNVGNSLFLAGAQIRRNSGISIYNSIIVGWPVGVLIDAGLGSPTDLNIADNTLRIKNTTLAGNTVNIKYTSSTTAATGASDASMLTWFSDVANNNNILTNVSDAKLIQPYNYTAVDPTPFAGANGNALINTGASFIDSKVAIPFFTAVTFRGGIAPAGVESNWWKGWTKF
jgi:hypothetical protein